MLLHTGGRFSIPYARQRPGPGLHPLRCLQIGGIEGAGIDAVAVEAQAMDLYASINQAADKLDRILERRIGRQRAGG